MRTSGMEAPMAARWTTTSTALGSTEMSVKPSPICTARATPRARAVEVSQWPRAAVSRPLEVAQKVSGPDQARWSWR